MDFHRTVYVDSLSLEFGQYGVTKEALQSVETPEAMELYCERAKSTALGKQIDEGAPATATAAAAPAEPAPAPAAAPEKPAVAQVPAGAVAPSDVGGGQAPVETAKFNDGKSENAMQENLNNMGWDTVKLPRS